MTGGRLFWTSVLVGWAIIAFGIFGALSQANRSHPRSVLIWLVAGLIAHDMLVAPIVFTAGRALRRVVPGRVRAAVHAGLILTGVFVIASIPVLGGFGRRADNLTILPRNYVVGLLVVLAVVWLATAAAMTWACRRRGD